MIAHMILDGIALFLFLFVGGIGTAAIALSVYDDIKARLKRRDDRREKLRVASRR